LLLALFLSSAALGASADIHSAAEMDRSAVVSEARPTYPYEARRQRIGGTGIAILEIDETTGVVRKVHMAQSTGSGLLDQEVLSTFKRWRFKPGTSPLVKVPITFAIGGEVYTEYKVDQKPMDNVLAGFLGKGTVLDGPVPEYPRFPPWTAKEGKGVYEIHAGKDGRATKVRIVKPSGDSTFDRIAVKTLGKWRFRRGPLIVELPLRFRLTPKNYSVDVAR
jgi:TonB family protein